jgi:3-methyladenine DNA glycosylase AlkD
MTTSEILQALEKYGDAKTKKTLIKHGAKEPFYGVKASDLKILVKKIKKNHLLSLELYATGNSDAMYLAGLIADENKISEAQLNDWLDKAYWYYLSEYTVPWVAAETPFGFQLGLKWIQSDIERVAVAGWNTLSNYASLKKDEDLDLEKYSELLELVSLQIHTAQNRVRHTMNGFVIAVGTSIKSLTEKAILVSNNIGTVQVDMGGTSCKVPLAIDYLHKNIASGQIGKKRKMPRG